MLSYPCSLPPLELTAEELALLQLSCTEGVGPVTSRGLIEFFGSAQAVVAASTSDLEAAPGVRPKLIRQLKSPTAVERAREELKILQAERDKGLPVEPYFITSNRYPDALRSCFDAPLVLYVKGQIPEQVPMIAIVGTRRCTHYSEELLHYLIEGFAKYCPDIVIVSGLAYGVDALAHRIALENGLRTIAVVAHGHYTLYPAAHRCLADEMIRQGGGVITEYPFFTRALPQRFVQRNRIVAGLSSATIITESAKKGGALITGNIAFDYDRDVYAAPGRAFDRTSEGCNKMISIEKARIITTPERLLEDLGLMPEEPQPRRLPFLDEEVDNDEPEHRIVKELREVGELTLEDLSAHLGVPLSTISAELFELEMDDKVRALPGGRYVLPHT